MDSSNSAFKVPMAPPQPQPSQIEALLFNDILEEKMSDLRQNMVEFLHVFPYHKFNNEFSKFLKHTKCMVLEEQRSGANYSRLTNSSQITSVYSRPSTSFNYRQPATLSIINSNRNSTLRLPENSFQPIESVNPFKPPNSVQYQPRVVLPRIEESRIASDRSVSLRTTVIEKSTNTNVNMNTNNSHHNFQLPVHLERSQSPTLNGYSDVTITENRSTNVSQQNYNTNDNGDSINLLLDEIGFKIRVGLPDNINMSKNNVSHHKNKQLQIIDKIEKFLSEWSINVKSIKSSSGSSKTIIILTGVLLREDKATVLEKNHDAGVLESRKDLDLVRTNKGLYRLIGKIINGSPYELYQSCVALCGVPRTWKKILKALSDTKKVTRNLKLNLSLDSPAGPLRPKANAIDMNISTTRNGKAYAKNINLNNKKTDRKRKFLEHSEIEKKSKQRKFNNQLSSLMSSTPKRPEKPIVSESPSLMLKKKILQNIILNKTTVNPNEETLNRLDDSIKVTNKRLSNSKKKINNSSTDHKSTDSLKNSLNISKKSKQAKQMEKMDSKISLSKHKPSNKEKSNDTKLRGKNKKSQCSLSTEPGLFDNIEAANDEDDDFEYMESPSILDGISRGGYTSGSETPPLFGNQWNLTTKSLVTSDPPTPLSKSVEAKALKRIKAPKITLKEEMKNNKKNNIKTCLDYNTVSKKINNLLMYGENYNDNED